MVIRQVKEQDVEVLAELEKICFPNDPWSLDSLYTDIVLNERTVYLAAEEEGDIIAYGGLWKIFDEGHITNIAVVPGRRREHVGEQLVTRLIDMTREEGLTSWTLEVRSDNAPAIALYEKLGFEKAGIRKGYYEYDGMDAIIMWKKDAPEEREG